MKTRPSILLACVSIVLLAILLVWFSKRSADTAPILSANTNSSTLPQARANGDFRPIDANQTNTRPVGETNASVLTKEQQKREGLATMNDVPIVFYGKLEDQFGNPVVGAQIRGNTIVYNGVRAGAEHVSVNSDANGLFQINAGTGESLGIWPRKEGYVLATTRTEFKYSYMYPEHFTPDPNNPVLVKMWKLQGAEPLTAINATVRLPFTNAPISFDLITGKTVPTGGDLTLTVNRPEGVISQQHPQDWSVSIDVIDGGLIALSDNEWGITYSAPEDGYVPRGTFENDNGSDVTRRTLLVRSRSGKIYAKVGFSFRINNGPSDLMYIAFNGAANTNSSRNLEATASR
jgi:hypothetical protein